MIECLVSRAQDERIEAPLCALMISNYRAEMSRRENKEHGDMSAFTRRRHHGKRAQTRNKNLAGRWNIENVSSKLLIRRR